MKNETLYWTIGGVALGLLALFAMSRGGGGSAPASTGGGGISNSTLMAEVNNVNNNAAAVESTRINAITSYAIHGSDNQVSVFNTLANDAAAELATIEGAQTSRYAADKAMQLGEYQANENYLTAQATLGEHLQEVLSNNQTTVQTTTLNDNLLHAMSDNSVTTARINHKSWFDTLIGAASNFFSSSTGAKVLGVGG